MLGRQQHRARPSAPWAGLHAAARGSARRRSRARPRSPARSQPAHIQYSGVAAHEDRQQHHRQRPGHHRDRQPQHEQRRTQRASMVRCIERSARARVAARRRRAGVRSRRSRCSAKAARSSCTRVPGTCATSTGASLGLRPARRRGRCAPGAARSRRRARPAGRAACRRPSAPCSGRRRSARPISASGPAGACGSRSASSGVCGQKNTASRRPPMAASSWFMCACTALTEAMSIRPRPMPDWLVATTACQPAWLSRATASSAPGIGYPFVGRLDVVVAVRVEDAVAAEDDELQGWVHAAWSGGQPGQVGHTVHGRVQLRSSAQAVVAQPGLRRSPSRRRRRHRPAP